MSDILLKAENISHQFNDQSVLQNIQLEIHAKEVITLIGPNGAGKSTLLSILLGLLKPTDGRLSRRDGLKIGFMPQKIQIDPTLPLTVRRFLELGLSHPKKFTWWQKFRCFLRSNQSQCLANKATATDQIRQTASARAIEQLDWDAIIKQLGIKTLLDKPIQKVSGGEMQRILLARALLRQPDLLVLDEPVQGVDLQGQAELYQYINELRNQYGVAILMVSHDLHLVMNHTDQVICLNQHVCCSGHPHSVSQAPEFKNLFGEHTEAIAIYEHHHSDQCEHTHGEGHIHLPDEKSIDDTNNPSCKGHSC